MGRASDAIEDWLGEPVADFAVKSAGVGLSGTLLEWIKTQGWASGVGDEILQAILGLAIRKFGDKVHDQLPNFGSGILYNLVGRVISENISPYITKSMHKQAGYPQAQVNQAFHQKYGRDPNAQEAQYLQQHFQAQGQQPIQQQVPAGQAPIVDYHYIQR